MTFTNVFDYQAFKTSLMNGTFGNIFYSQVDPIPLACPEIKKLSEELDQKIANINNFKITEEQAQQEEPTQVLSNWN